MDIFLVAVQLILKDFSSLFCTYCCLFFGFWGFLRMQQFFPQAFWQFFFLHASNLQLYAGIHPLIAILLDWSTQIGSLQIPFQSWVKFQVFVFILLHVVSFLHMDSNFPSSIFRVQQEQFISQLHWAKICFWAGVARGHVSKAEFSLIWQNCRKRRADCSKMGRAPCREIQDILSLLEREIKLLSVCRLKEISFNCAVKVSFASLIYWTITLFVHSIIYSLDYLNEWLFMIQLIELVYYQYIGWT